MTIVIVVFRVMTTTTTPSTLKQVIVIIVTIAKMKTVKTHLRLNKEIMKMKIAKLAAQIIVILTKMMMMTSFIITETTKQWQSIRGE